MSVIFEFWDDSEYRAYGDEVQRILLSNLAGRPKEVWLPPPHASHCIQHFDAVERGVACQKNTSTGTERHMRLRPPYQLAGAAPAQPPDLVFQCETERGWQDYHAAAQQQLRLLCACTPVPELVMLSVGFEQYYVTGLPELVRSGSSALQTNLCSRRTRAVRAACRPSTPQLPVSLSALGFCACWSNGASESVVGEAKRLLLAALRVKPRASSVTLQSGDVVTGFDELETGGARCVIGGETVEVVFPDPRSQVSLPGRGALSLPRDLDAAGALGHCGSEVEPTQDDCSICLLSLSDGSGCFRLLCGHEFHRPCIATWFAKKPRCPICGPKVHFGKLTGEQPSHGASMSWRVEEQPLPGEDCQRTIVVSFDFSAGTEAGARYQGRQETCYLPGSSKGVVLFELFKVAFRRRLMFGLGQSMTGIHRPTFNIHLKTKARGGAQNHGYPDPGYFCRCIGELRANGVTLSDLPA